MLYAKYKEQKIVHLHKKTPTSTSQFQRGMPTYTRDSPRMRVAGNFLGHVAGLVQSKWGGEGGDVVTVTAYGMLPRG